MPLRPNSYGEVVKNGGSGSLSPKARRGRLYNLGKEKDIMTAIKTTTKEKLQSPPYTRGERKA